jgi:hypothetical protein
VCPSRQAVGYAGERSKFNGINALIFKKGMILIQIEHGARGEHLRG